MQCSVTWSRFWFKKPFMQQVKIMMTRHWRNYSRQSWVSLASCQPQRKPDALCHGFQHTIDDLSPFRRVSWKWFAVALVNLHYHADFLHINILHESMKAIVLKGRLHRTGQGVSVYIFLKCAIIPTTRRIFKYDHGLLRETINFCPTLILL